MHRKLTHSIKGSHKNKETSLLNFCIFPKTLEHAVNNTMYCVRVVVLRSVYLCKNFPRRRGHYFCGKKRQDTGRYLGVCKVLFTALESNRFNFSENLIVDFPFLILQCFHSALLSLFENE